MPSTKELNLVPLPEVARMRPLTGREESEIIKRFSWWETPRSDLTIQRGPLEPLDEDMRFPAHANGVWRWRNTAYRWVTRGRTLLREVVWYDDIWRFIPVWAYTLTKTAVDMDCPFYGASHMRRQWLDYLTYVRNENDDPLSVIDSVRRPERRRITVRARQSEDGVVLLSDLSDLSPSVQAYLQISGSVGGPYKIGVATTLTSLGEFPGISDIRKDGETAVISMLVSSGDMPRSVDRQQVLEDLRLMLSARSVKTPSDPLLSFIERADMHPQPNDGSLRQVLLSGQGKSLVWAGSPQIFSRVRRSSRNLSDERQLSCNSLHLLEEDGTILESMPQPQGSLQVLMWPDDAAKIARAFRVMPSDVHRLCRVGWTGVLN